MGLDHFSCWAYGPVESSCADDHIHFLLCSVFSLDPFVEDSLDLGGNEIHIVLH